METITREEAANRGYIQLLINDANGIYIPKFFAQNFDIDNEWTGINDVDKETLLAGPDGEWYWEAWETVLNNAKHVDADGHEWRLEQDGDLFAVRTDVEIEE